MTKPYYPAEVVALRSWISRVVMNLIKDENKVSYTGELDLDFVKYKIKIERKEKQK